MDAADESSYKKHLGITCLNCQQVTLGPNRELDNWSCGYCHSGFLSLKMLNNLAPRELMAQLNAKVKNSAKKPRPCAMCEGPMDYRAADFNSKHLEVEVCPSCRLVWFDSGDLVRSLRHRRDETVETREQKITEDRAPKQSGLYGAPRRVNKAGADFFPAATVSLLVVAALLFTLVARDPALFSRLAFDPFHPFRLGGLTWGLSLFLHNELNSFLTAAIPFFFLGSFVEYQLKAGQLVTLFFAGGLVGRFQTLIGRANLDPVVHGMSCAVTSVTVYVLMTFPYRQLFYPQENKWRSPREAASWWLVMIAVITVFYIGCNYLWEGLRGFAAGSSTSMYEHTIWGAIGNWLNSNDFKSHVAAAGVGLLWWLADAVGTTKKNRS